MVNLCYIMKHIATGQMNQDALLFGVETCLVEKGKRFVVDEINYKEK